MCVVSMISDWGMRRWPVNPINPNDYQNIPDFPTRKEWEEFKDLIKRAIEYDERTKQPDCIDPEKEKWMKAIEKRLDELERKL